MKVWIGVLCVCGLLGLGCGDEGGGAGSGGAGGSGGSGGGPAARGTYADVSMILGGPEQGTKIGSCAAGSCHGPSTVGGASRARAELDMKEGDTLLDVLVDVPSCENPDMVRVKPGNPDESWLWVKLTAPIADESTGMIDYTGTPATDCTGVTTGFGTRMPAVAPFMLAQDKLDLIRTWIEDGAQGPL